MCEGRGPKGSRRVECLRSNYSRETPCGIVGLVSECARLLGSRYGLSGVVVAGPGTKERCGSDSEATGGFRGVGCEQ